MQFSLRELVWMYEARMELENSLIELSLDGTFQSMANQMANAITIASGKRCDPAVFYKPAGTRRKDKSKAQGINQDGFAMMKSVFVKDKTNGR
jgi:hypothetical protein